MSQTVLLDENFSNGIPSNWRVVDGDQLIPDSSVMFVNQAWVGFSTSVDTCAVSTSYYTVNAGQVSASEDYLITPKLNLLSFGHLFSWDSKSFDANYPESYYVLLSSTDSLIESFTDTLKYVNNDSPNWKRFTINLFSMGYANQPVYLAFKNASTDAYLLGLDNVKLTTDDVTAVADQANQQFELYPNPVTTDLHVTVASNTVYEIVNVAGKVVKRGLVYNQVINCAELSAGVYVLRLQIENQMIPCKLIKL